MNRKHPPIARPRLEALEDRALPSCVVFVREDTLFIRGDDADNVVRLTARGPQVSVACDRDPAETYDGIHQIVANLGAGDDVLNAELLTPSDPVAAPSPVSLRLVVQGGRGDDDISAVMGVEPTPFRPAEFHLTMAGGDGNDILTASARVGGVPPDDGTPAERSTVRFHMAMHGGRGDDDISAVMGIEPTPFLPAVEFDLSANGGAGNDVISAAAVVRPGAAEGFNPQPEPPAPRFAMSLSGGRGDDVIVARSEFEPTQFLPAAEFNLNADGGAGSDVLLATQFDTGAAAPSVDGVRVVLFGGAGDDILLGGGANDVLSGGAGNDVLSGGGGNDVLFGGAGNDFLYGGTGSDLLFGNDGDDVLVGAGDLNGVTFTNDGAPDYLHGGAGADRFGIHIFDIVADFDALEGDVINFL